MTDCNAILDQVGYPPEYNREKAIEAMRIATQPQPAPQDLRERVIKVFESIAFEWHNAVDAFTKFLFDYTSEVSAEKDKRIEELKASLYSCAQFDTIQKQRIAELEAIIKDVDSIIGYQTRKITALEDSEMKRKQWLSKAKAEAGYDTFISFDDVWKEILTKAKSK